MKKFFNRALLACSLLLTGGAASAQGLQGVVVEEYYTITAADSTFIADAGVVSEAPPVGAKVYRVFVDMLPNYKFLTVTGGPAAQGNTLDFTTTTKFWNQDALADQHAGNTRFLFQNGQAFDSFITIHTTGKANGTSANCAAFGGGTGSFNQQVGVLKTEDTNANLTLCQAYTGFPTGSNDGNIPAPFAIGTAFSGFFTTTDFDALTTNTNTGSWTMVDDGYAITPPVTGVDPAGTNRVLIGQFTTDGQFSFHINVAIQNPQGVDEYYTWTNPNTGIGEQVSSFLTYPQVLPPDCNGVPGGPAVPGSPCNDLNACTTNDLWNASCQCVGTDISQTFTSSASACDTYTWAQNGQTYTASGTYTATAGCDTYVLNLTITPSTSNTTTASACDTYTWSVNGQTYTASGTYTAVTGCSTEILNLTITPSSSQSESATQCGTSYIWAVNGQSYNQSGTYTAVIGCVTYTLNLTLNVPGTPCDDGNNNTINDQLDLNCNCVGTPVGPGCDFNEVELVVVNDAVSLVSYEVRVQGTNVLTANGSVNPATGLTVQDICLPDGCYYLVVSDNGGDGIVGGGYVLRLAAGGRLIDNTGNMTVSPSQIAANEGFCLPLGADRLIATSCDKLDWRTVPCVPEYVVANANALVSAQYGVTNSTSGYQMWWYDPNGGYSFKRFQSHNTTNGLAASATRACHFKINAWTGNQLQEGVLYNVKVRGRVAGTYNAWGAACRFSLNNAAAQCPQARLNDIAGNQFFSCGVTRPVAANAYVYSTVVRRMQANCNWLNANRYQFRFRIPAESFELVKTSSTWSVNTIGLACDKTYEVDVRASFDNGASWCATGDPYGTVCTVTTTACSSSMTQETTGGTAVEARISMYPNPNRGDQVFLSIGSIEEGVETVSVDIFDAFGKRVSARTIAAQDGFVNSVVELNGELSAGFYLVNVTAGSASWSERLVVQR